MNPREPVLVARGIRRDYLSGGESLPVLNGIDLELFAGEWVTLLGPSGSGKSTLLRILGTLEDPSAGEVLLEGRRITGQSEESLARLRSERLGFVFQFHHLLGEFTAEENVALPALLAGVPRNRALEQARALLQRVGLDARRLHRPGELSGGEQQRVAVARALVNRPAVVLADEPTGNLDPGHAREVEALLAEISGEHGAALLVATHNPGTASKSKRVLVLEGGLAKPLQSL